LAAGFPVLSVWPSTPTRRLGRFFMSETISSMIGRDSGRISALPVSK
jgi:hypothetical protein